MTVELVTVELVARQDQESPPRHFHVEVAEWDEISPELAVTPVLAGWPDPAPIPGWWRVTHRPTGRALCPPCCRDCATAVGLALSALPIPWGQLTAEQAAKQLAQLPDAGRLRHTIRQVITAAARCPHPERS